MASHASILAWDIPWTEKPGGLQFIPLENDVEVPEKIKNTATI